ncbi:hypothetical protein ACFWZ2_42155 [Streptomyces sp. NPDC059002]|uniref:hypothetical protein n=1 Tax=Streptomyces sp. NPDC059002 TaxID=3346690 RepID=UPI0036889BF8
MSDSYGGPQDLGPEPVEEPEPQVPAEPSYDPSGPAPLGVERTPTGNADVDSRLARLGDADHLATDGHIEVYEDVHRGLRDALTALDARPGPPVPSPAGSPSSSSSPSSSYDNRS